MQTSKVLILISSQAAYTSISSYKHRQTLTIPQSANSLWFSSIR